MPNGMSGPGKVWTPPEVPMSGLTSAAGSPTGGGVTAPAGPPASDCNGSSARARTAAPTTRLRNLGASRRRSLAIACLHRGGRDFTDDASDVLSHSTQGPRPAGRGDGSDNVANKLETKVKRAPDAVSTLRSPKSRHSA